MFKVWTFIWIITWIPVRVQSSSQESDLQQKCFQLKLHRTQTFPKTALIIRFKLIRMIFPS